MNGDEVAESNRLYCHLLIGVSETDTWDVCNPNNNDEIYYPWQKIRIWARDKDLQTNLTGTIFIFSCSSGYNFEDELINQGDGVYYYIWDTAGLSVAKDYRVEVTLSNPDDGLSGVDYLIQLINPVEFKCFSNIL